jgi:hypothetical protein
MPSAIIQHASRAPQRQLPRPITETARAGLRYETKVFKALQASKFGKVERSPAFTYRNVREASDRVCIPDILLWDEENEYIIVTEVKLTWVPAAAAKLRDLYCPVVSKALDLPTKPLLIVKNLIPESPLPTSRLSFALLAQNPLLCWRENGPILI